MFKHVVFVSILSFVTSLVFAAPELKWPVHCDIGETCFITTLFDHGRGVDASGLPVVLDYTGGTRSVNDYYGTQIQIYNSSIANNGAEVLSAADGTVVSVRDKLPSDPYAITVLGTRLRHSVGNSVVVDHGGGWETQYSGLMQDSVPVKLGDKVKAGTVLGKIERLATQNYPSMQFVVRYKSLPVDPFVGRYTGAYHKNITRAPLWKDTFEQIAFTRDVGLIATGFSKEVPVLEKVKRSMVEETYLRTDDDQVLFWSYLFGLKVGDHVNLALYNPQGRVVARHEETLVRPQERYFAYVGRKAETEGLPVGVYRGSVTVKRAGEELLSDIDTVRVNQF